VGHPFLLGRMLGFSWLIPAAPSSSDRALALLAGEDPDAERAALDRMAPAAVLAVARPLQGPRFVMTGKPVPRTPLEGVVLRESNPCP